jgi:hypothetical protein
MVVGELMEEVEAYSKHLKTTQLLQMFFFFPDGCILRELPNIPIYSIIGTAQH